MTFGFLQGQITNIQLSLFALLPIVDAASRLATLSDGTYITTNTHLAYSPLVGQVTFKSNTVTRMTMSMLYH
jgi:hypothetical protein